MRSEATSGARQIGAAAEVTAMRRGAAYREAASWPSRSAAATSARARVMRGSRRVMRSGL